MELNVNDRVIEDPTSDDVAQALAAPSFPDGWFVTLEDESGATLDAQALPGGFFALAHFDENDVRRNATPNVSAKQLKAILIGFLTKEPAWRKRCEWRAARSTGEVATRADKLTGRSGREPPTWAIVAVVIAINFIILMSLFDQWEADSFLRSLIPYGDSDYLGVGVVFLPLVVMLIAALINAVIETNRAAGWTKTTGRIVRSEVERRAFGVRESGEKQEFRDEAALAYEFKTASGAIVRGSRVSVVNEYVGSDAATAVKRYPAGATVEVFYDPGDPRTCALERGNARGFSERRMIVAVAAFLFIVGAIWWTVARGPSFLARHFPRATSDAQFTVILIGAGLALTIVSVVMRRKARADASQIMQRENSSGMAWYPMALALGCFALAAWRLGLFG